MMDGTEIEVDDLFGDPGTLGDTSLNVPLGPADLGPLHDIQVPVRGLAQRIDDLHSSGCCRKIAWSRQGCIAYISKDGLQVNIQCLRFEPASGKWALSSNYLATRPDTFGGHHTLVHLEWSQTGGDLALLDAAGRIAILSLSMNAINQLTPSRSAEMDEEDELSRAVGVLWLSPDRQNIMVLQSSKESDRWAHITTRRRPLGPYWPRALAIVTRGGSFRLIYQKPDQRWSTAKVDLKSLGSTGCLVTHAALAPTSENKILVATQTFDRKLFIYFIQLSWPDFRQDPSAEMIPSFHVEQVRGFLRSGMADGSTTDDILNDASIYMPNNFRLSHLDIIATSDGEKVVQLPPMILAVYISSVNSLGMSSEGQPPTSAICRWNVAPIERKLHPHFNEVASKTNNTSLARKIGLQKLPDVRINQVITSIQQVDNGNGVAISTHDGSTTLYNPATMTQLYLESDINEVTSMSQSGFTLPMNQPTSLHIAFSPSCCVSASINEDGKLDLACIEYHSGLPTDALSTENDPGFDAALASISLSFARACYSNFSIDDLIFCVLHCFGSEQNASLLRSLYRSLFREADLIAGPSPASELDKVPHKQMVARVLVLQAALGQASSFQDIASNNISQPQPKRSLAASHGWITLNIRYVAVLFYIVLTSAKSNEGLDYAEPEILDVVCNNIRWALDLFKLIVDDLFEMVESPGEDTKTALGDINGTLPEAPTATLATLLVTSLWSRYFLRTISRVLRGLLNAPKSLGYNLADAGLLAFNRIAETIQSSSLSLEAFERLLSMADKFAQLAYQEAGYGDRERADTEREIMATGNIHHTVLGGVVERLCEEVLPTTRGEVDRLALFVGDYDWVTLDIVVPSEAAHGGGKGRSAIDIHKKRAIRGDGEVRRCIRCGSVNMDVGGPPKTWPKFSQQQTMRCVCDSTFVVEGLSGS